MTITRTITRTHGTSERAALQTRPTTTRRHTTTALAPPGGVLDPAFGVEGIARHAVRGRAVDMRVLAAGRVAVLTDGVGATMAVTVLRADGTLDGAFGTRGTARLGAFDQPVFARAMAAQPDGRILVAGIAAPPGPVRIAIFRLTVDGQLDPTFSGDGRLTVTFPDATSPDAGGTLDVAAVVVQRDGRIVVVGTAMAAQSSIGRIVAARFQADGGLDLSYGVAGRMEIALPGSLGRATGAVLDATDSLVVAARTFLPGTESDMVALRLRPDGTPDPTFGADGLAISDFGFGNDIAADVALQRDGRIVIAGSAQVGPTSTRPAVIRLMGDGRLDPTFGVGGRAVIDLGLPAGVHAGRSVVLLSDGRIAVAGTAEDLSGEIARPYVAVLTSTGGPDRTLAADGVVLPPLTGGTGETGAAVAAHLDGRIVAAFCIGPDKGLAVLQLAGQLG